MIDLRDYLRKLNRPVPGETPDQRSMLADLGIRYGQGYLFSRPLAAEQYRQTALTEMGGPDTAVPFPRLADEVRQHTGRAPIRDGF